MTHRFFYSISFCIISFFAQAQTKCTQVLVPYLAGEKYGLCDTNAHILLQPQWDILFPKQQKNMFVGVNILGSRKKNYGDYYDRKTIHYLIYDTSVLLTTEHFHEFDAMPFAFVIAHARDGAFTRNQEYDETDSNGKRYYKDEESYQKQREEERYYRNVKILYNWQGKNMLPNYCRRIHPTTFYPKNNAYEEPENITTKRSYVFTVEELDGSYSIVELNTRKPEQLYWLAKDIYALDRSMGLLTIIKKKGDEPKAFSIEYKNGAFVMQYQVNEEKTEREYTQQQNQAMKALLKKAGVKIPARPSYQVSSNNKKRSKQRAKKIPITTIADVKVEQVDMVDAPPPVMAEPYGAAPEKRYSAEMVKPAPLQHSVLIKQLFKYGQKRGTPLLYTTSDAKDTFAIAIPSTATYTTVYKSNTHSIRQHDTNYTYNGGGALYKDGGLWGIAPMAKKLVPAQYDSIVNLESYYLPQPRFLVSKKINNSTQWAIASEAGIVENSTWCDSISLPKYYGSAAYHRADLSSKQWLILHRHGKSEIYNYYHDSLAARPYDKISFGDNYSLTDAFATTENSKHGIIWYEYGNKPIVIEPIYTQPVDAILDNYNGWHGCNILRLQNPVSKKEFYATTSGREFVEPR